MVIIRFAGMDFAAREIQMPHFFALFGALQNRHERQERQARHGVLPSQMDA